MYIKKHDRYNIIIFLFLLIFIFLIVKKFNFFHYSSNSSNISSIVHKKFFLKSYHNNKSVDNKNNIREIFKTYNKKNIIFIIKKEKNKNKILKKPLIYHKKEITKKKIFYNSYEKDNKVHECHLIINMWENKNGKQKYYFINNNKNIIQSKKIIVKKKIIIKKGEILFGIINNDYSIYNPYQEILIKVISKKFKNTIIYGKIIGITHNNIVNIIFNKIILSDNRILNIQAKAIDINNTNGEILLNTKNSIYLDNFKKLLFYIIKKKIDNFLKLDQNNNKFIILNNNRKLLLKSIIKSSFKKQENVQNYQCNIKKGKILGIIFLKNIKI